MKKHIVYLSLTCIHLFAFGQSFQKIYGNTDNQQDNYAITTASADYFIGGTYKNYTTFPNMNFYGSLSRFESDGSHLWSKVYQPDGFQPMDAFFIRSVINKGDTALVCLGEYLGNGNGNSGYCLFQTNLNGDVSWAKLYSTQDIPNEFGKLIPGNNCLYLLTSTNIIQLDPTGNVIHVIGFQVPQIDLKDLSVTSAGNLVITGELLLNNQFSSIILQLESNLNFINGYRYSQSGSGFASSEVSELSNNRFLLTGNQFLMAAQANTGQVEWAKYIQSEGNAVDSIYVIQQNVELLPIDNSASNFLLLSESFFSDDFGNFQYYITSFQLNANGTISHARNTKTTSYNSQDQLHPGGMYLDTATSEFVVVGNYTNINDWHLNYIQKVELANPGCGEEPRTIPVIDFPIPVTVQSFASQDIITSSVTTNNLTMFTADLPMNLTNDFCTQLGSDEFDLENIRIYPNPTTGELAIITEHSVKFDRIIDLTGREISGYTLNGTIINGLDMLECGTYFVQVSSDNNTFLIPFKKL